MTTLMLVRTAAERAGDAVVIDDTPAGELVARIFAAPRAVVWGEPPRTLDLSGEVCPFTFVRTKLALEEMPAGARLIVRVDHAPAVKNVPRSAAEWGQRVLGVAAAGAGRWDIYIEKPGERAEAREKATLERGAAERPGAPAPEGASHSKDQGRRGEP